MSTVFFVRDAASSPYREPWAWGGRDAADHARLDAVDLITDDQIVRASPHLLPLLAERRQIYALDTTVRPQVRDAIEVPVDQRSDPASRELVDVVILDDAAAPDWTDNEHRVFREALVREGYERIFTEAGIEVFLHTGLNAEGEPVDP